MVCSKCATILPDDSQFCLKCGQAVNGSAKTTLLVTNGAPATKAGTTPEATAVPRWAPTPRRPWSRITVWILGVVLLLGFLWAASSNHPFAQQLREYAGSHTEAVGETVFSVKPRSFSSYKFTVPPGAANVVVSGQFSATGGSENDVEVYVLTDDAFVTLRSGYAASTYYDSGRVSQSNFQATLPFGGGAYYLVFDNRFSLRTPKLIHAVSTLHYNNWWPEILVRLREKILNALGM